MMKVTIKVGKHSMPIPKGAAEMIEDFLAEAGFDYEVTAMLGQRVRGTSHLKGVRVVKIASVRGVQLRAQPGDNDTAYMYVVSAPAGMSGSDFYDQLVSVGSSSGVNNGEGEKDESNQPPPPVFPLLPIGQLFVVDPNAVAMEVVAVAEEAMATADEMEKHVASKVRRVEEMVDSVRSLQKKLEAIDGDLSVAEDELLPIKDERAKLLVQLKVVDEQIASVEGRKRTLKFERNRLFNDFLRARDTGRELVAELRRLRSLQKMNFVAMRIIRDDIAKMMDEEEDGAEENE